MQARAAQALRFGGDGTANNARMDSRQLRAHVDLSDPCLLLMKQALDELGLSARAYDKVRRVARTIADLEGAAEVARAAHRRGRAVPVAGPEVLTARGGAAGRPEADDAGRATTRPGPLSPAFGRSTLRPLYRTICRTRSRIGPAGRSSDAARARTAAAMASLASVAAPRPTA